MGSFDSVLALLSLAAVVFLFTRKHRPLPLPPGPKGLPIIGNFFNRPTKNAWLVYKDWGTSYKSDIVSMEVLGQPTIVINTVEVAKELLEGRSDIYADRPRLYMLTELMRWSWGFSFMRYSADWTLHRKVFHQYFGPSQVADYRDVQTKAAVRLLRNVLEQPEGLFHHVRHCAGSVILFLVYGYDVAHSNDKLVHLADEAFKTVSWAIVPGSYMVDYFPILRHIPAWFPFAGFKKEAEAAKLMGEQLANVPFDMVLNSMKEGSSVPSFVTASIEKLQLEMKNSDSTREERMRVIKNSGGIAFFGGADTTVALILTTLLAMVLSPDIQARAQAELDDVVGRSRPPTFDDRASMPFVEAVILEALRWRPVAAIPLPHASQSDDIFNGYFIPKGSIVLLNTWTMMHDEETYPNPGVYNPDRYLGEHPQPHPTVMGVWGFGRRICPGRYLAMDTAFIAIASLLWAFTFKKARDVNGEEIVPDDTAYTDVFIMHPLPFQCDIVPRFAVVEELVRESE
ncbi:cytochrome P450 [Hymenopellis radicata]|nr:cytochrome P450 [Hymenopellis radicata]